MSERLFPPALKFWLLTGSRNPRRSTEDLWPKFWCPEVFERIMMRYGLFYTARGCIKVGMGRRQFAVDLWQT